MGLSNSNICPYRVLRDVLINITYLFRIHDSADNWMVLCGYKIVIYRVILYNSLIYVMAHSDGLGDMQSGRYHSVISLIIGWH
jgi:hypothetical protein